MAEMKVVSIDVSHEALMRGADEMRVFLIEQGRQAGRAEILALVRQRLGSNTIPSAGPYERGYSFACQVVEQVVKEYDLAHRRSG